MVNNNLYRCVSNHTSTTFSSDISNWELIYASVGNWQASTYYPVGVFAVNNKKLYKCKTQHTSGSTFSDTNWDLIAGGGGAEINNWSTSTQYKVGDLVIRENNLYRCKTAHTSSAFNTDIANWIKLDNISDWKQNTYYAVGDYLYYDKNLYKVTTAFTSSTTFSATNLEMLGGVPLSSADVTNVINSFDPVVSAYNTTKEMYTTTERAVGIWVDGKTIYQRTWVGLAGATSANIAITLIDFSSSTLETIVEIKALCSSDNLCRENVIDANSGGPLSSGTLGTSVWYAYPSKKLMHICSSTLINRYITLTLKYTKA